MVKRFLFIPLLILLLAGCTALSAGPDRARFRARAATKRVWRCRRGAGAGAHLNSRGRNPANCRERSPGPGRAAPTAAPWSRSPGR